MTATPHPRHRASGKLPVHERLRWTLEDASAVVDLCPNTVRDLIRRGEFPPRITVDGKKQFVPAEVRAWASGGDWRGMVAARHKLEEARAS